MKIAIVITGLGMGGAERQVCDLADQFIKIGHKVLLIVMTGEIVNRPYSAEVDVALLKMKKNPLSFVNSYWEAVKLLRQYKPDVVHSHMVHANLFTRLVRLMIFIPKLICSAHSINEGGDVYMLAYRLTDRLCDLSTNVSQAAVDIFIKRGAVAAGRMQVMYNGIDTRRFSFNVVSRMQLRFQLGVKEDAILLLAVGRLTAAKDYKNLLKAFARLSSQYSYVQLFIIGEGEDKAYLMSMVAAQGLMARVHFLGLRYDIEKWMSAADIFVLSSAWEGFSLVVAEAMATELLVVATDCGGVKEVVGTAGLLVPPQDSIRLSAAIEHALLLSPLEKEAITQEARSRIIKHYSIKVISQHWLTLYQDCL